MVAENQMIAFAFFCKLSPWTKMLESVELGGSKVECILALESPHYKQDVYG